MSFFNLEIVTMDSEFFKGEVFEVIVPSHDGYMGILPGHVPYITILQSGSVKLKNKKTDKEFKTYELTGGFCEVTGQNVIIFADSIT